MPSVSIVGVFRQVHEGRYMQCLSHIDASGQASMVFGEPRGFRRASRACQYRMSSDVTVLARSPSVMIRLYHRVLHFASTCGRAHPPSCFGRWSVVMGTRKVVPCQRNQEHVDVICCACTRGRGKICTTCHIFANRQSCM
jgi:hypothetical protein